MDFDPNAYLDAPLSQPLQRRPPVPNTQDYISVIQEVVARQWQSKDKYDEVTGQLKSGLVFDITHLIDLPEAIQSIVGIKQLTLKDGVMIDLTRDGAIDESIGKNNRLRQYREALGMNNPGEVFRPRQMVGRLIKVRLTYEEYQGNMMEKVGALSKA